MKWRLLLSILLLSGMGHSIHAIEYMPIPADLKINVLRGLMPLNTEFEFLNSTDKTLYIELGNLDEKSDIIDVEQNKRIVSAYGTNRLTGQREYVTYITLSLVPEPRFAQDSSLYVFNPNKKVYVEAILDDRGDIIVREQTGKLGVKGTGGVLQFGRLMGEKAGLELRGKLGSTTISGLKLRNSVGGKDILRLPNPFMPYGNKELAFYDAVRFSQDNVPELEKAYNTEFVDRFAFEDWLEKEKNLDGWTLLHEAALWKYGYVYNYIRDKLGILEQPDDNNIMPLQLYNSQKDSGVLGYFNAVIAKGLSEKIDQFLDAQKYIEMLKNDEPVEIPKGVGLSELESFTGKIDAALSGINATFEADKIKLIEKASKAAVKAAVFLSVYNLQQFVYEADEFFNEVTRIIERLESGQELEPVSELAKRLDSGVIMRMQRSRQVLSRVLDKITNAEVKKVLRKTVGDIAEIMQRKQVDMSNKIGLYLPREYDILVKEFSVRLDQEEPVKLDEIYEFIGSNNEEGPILSYDAVRQKIEEKQKQLGYFPASLRQIGYIMGYKSFYDLYLQGKDTYELFLESEQAKRITDVIHFLKKKTADIIWDIFKAEELRDLLQ